jgi:KDO2-lipid IV(A) lauroyltransferase
MSTLLRGLFATIFTLMGHLPLPLLHGFATILGRLAWYVPNDLKRVTQLHLDLCLAELPATDREKIARDSLVHMVKALCEAPAIWFGPEARVRQWLHDDAARDTLRRILADSRGAIILCPHIGSWELAGLFCSTVGRITSLYKPQGETLDSLLTEGRARFGAQLVPTTGGGVKALLGALRKGEMVGILPDQDPPWGAGVFAPLFGLPAHTSELVTRLAARTGAPVWFCYAERLRRGRGFRFHITPAPPQVDNVELGAAKLNQGIEAVLTHLPEQYWWSYKRYRRQPAGSLNPYARLKR